MFRAGAAFGEHFQHVGEELARLRGKPFGEIAHHVPADEAAVTMMRPFAVMPLA